MVLQNLEPKKVFKYFEEISKIPRGSGNEKAISDYLVNFAKERNLEVYQDEALNVIIKKPGTKGYENSKKIILQGHMDMVNEKSEDSDHDFDKDPIEIILDGDFIHANKTTLGADNGIGVAMSLAILDSDNIEHAPLEVLVTVSEETDMHGAQVLSDSILEGDYLINIDSEEEGIMTVASAGGELYFAHYTPELEEIPKDYKFYDVKFSGFLGGHSGGEIANNRGNMVKVMADFLVNLKDVMLIDFLSGSKDNAIPSNGIIKLAIKDNSEFDDLIKSLYEKYKSIEGNLNIVYSDGLNEKTAQSIESTKDFANYLLDQHTGVKAFTDETKEFVELSSTLAIVKKIEDGTYEIWNSMRFGKRNEFEEFKNDFVEMSKKYPNAKYEFTNYYPEWEYKEDSKLRDIARDLYKDFTGKTMEIDITHGGLECGVFYIKYKHLDMISIGPDIFEAHTPRERASVSSIKRMYEYIIELLKHLK